MLNPAVDMGSVPKNHDEALPQMAKQWTRIYTNKRECQNGDKRWVQLAYIKECLTDHLQSFMKTIRVHSRPFVVPSSWQQVSDPHPFVLFV